MRSFASFIIDDKLFGIDILLIREINRQLEMSPVAHTPDFIRGLVNLRGQIVTILDLKKRLGRDKTIIGAETHNIILKSDSELSGLGDNLEDENLVTCVDKIGLLVDAIGDVVTVDDDSAVELPPANLNDVDSRFLSGVVKLENQLLAVLNIPQILAEVS